MNFNELKQLVAFEKYHFGSDKVWNDIPTILKNELLKSFRILNYRKDQIVYQENGIPVGIYFLKKGKVKKYKIGPTGTPQIFYIATEGELLGYHPLFSNEYYPNTTETLEPCEIGFIPRAAFENLYQSSHEFKDQLIKLMSHEYAVLINHITIMSQHNSRERLAIMLLLLKDKYKTDLHKPSEITLSRIDLANYVGTARENLIRLLNEFKTSGIIETKGRNITILKPEKLVKLANITIL